MSIVLNEFIKLADDAFALRFLRLMTMPVQKTAAFKTGIIDKDFQKIKTPETKEEQAAYTLFHRLAFNLKRLVRKLPFGKLTLSSYLAALWMIKDHTQMSDDDISKVLKESCDINLNDCLLENSMFINKNYELIEGNYILNKNLLHPLSGEELILKGSEIIVEEDIKPYGKIFETPVFKVYHPKTKSYVYITQGDIKDA